MELAIKNIRTDGGTQSRAQIDQSAIDSYAEAIEDGATFPPVEVVYDGKEYWLWDGFHRLPAAMRAGLKTINANVRPGTQADAQWLSYGANITNGLYRSNDDKRRAVAAALAHPNAASLSDRQIAAHCGVHFNTVGKLRKECGRDSTITRCDSRTGRDGRTINTANIGKRPARETVHEIVNQETGEVQTVQPKRIVTMKEYEELAGEALPQGACDTKEGRQVDSVIFGLNGVIDGLSNYRNWNAASKRLVDNKMAEAIKTFEQERQG